MPVQGKTSSRGYGGLHRRERAKWVRRQKAGETLYCARCHEPIQPGQQWDLGHVDGTIRTNHSQWSGPEHARAKDCTAGGNRATKGRMTKRPNNIYLVTGPPASGKSTWVREHAQPGDITIDFDAIANVLTPPDGKPHKHTPAVQAITKAARQAAIDAALSTPDVDVYIIHSAPGAQTLQRYQTLGAHVITVDPGEDIVLARCRAERPWQIQQAAKIWYRQQTSAASQQTPSAAPALGWFNGP